jgi:hypothetical protein
LLLLPLPPEDEEFLKVIFNDGLSDPFRSFEKVDDDDDVF